MTADFLLELRCEEIPARMQAKAREDLARLFTEHVGAAGLSASGLVTYVTPRRLALIARDLPLETRAVSEEHKGPRTSAPEQALEGFLRKTGLTRDRLEDRNGIWFAVVDKPGRASVEVLAQAIPAIIRAFPWPRSMRWGPASSSTESLRWVRPLHGIVALLGEELVPVEVDGITSGYATLGHRFHHPGAPAAPAGTGAASGDATTPRAGITIGSSHDYVEKLRACHVIVDQGERMAIIAQKARALAVAAGLNMVEDSGLVAENAGLTEWPVPLLGWFDPAFLEVPPEVIQLTLRTNQKYFVLRDSEGKLAPAFICTANIEARDGGKAIVEGNGKVLAARLSDARFFWEQDRRTTLEEQAKKLERITFHDRLGTVADKVARVARLAEWLASEGIVPDCDPALARQAAELCKADLVTEMVGEFPELQGLMGGYYARAEGLPDAVADAIRDHYRPVGQGDEVPTAPVTVAVSLADKLDTLVGFFGIDEKPTGSKDPFALRRAALAIIVTQFATGARFHIPNVVEKIVEFFRPQAFVWAINKNPIIDLAKVNKPIDIWSINHEKDGDYLTFGGQKYGPFERYASEELTRESRVWGCIRTQLGRDVSEFFADRLKVQQREAGVRHDLIDAVFALGNEDDLVRLLARVNALQSFITTADGANLLAGYKRAANILKKEEVDAAAPRAAPSEPAEIALAAALDTAEPQAEAAIEAEDFEGAMAALAGLRAPIDAFFDPGTGVMVNDADPAKRAMRLDLLQRVRVAVHKVADFSRIEG